jgi:hypothetical protein
MRDDEQRMVFMVDTDDNEIMPVCQHYQIFFFPVVSVDLLTSLSGDSYVLQSELSILFPPGNTPKPTLSRPTCLDYLKICHNFYSSPFEHHSQLQLSCHASALTTFKPKRSTKLLYAVNH